jgi:hypothetical protein
MSNLEQRCAGRKPQTFTGGKLDLMNAVDFDLRIDPYAARVFRAIIFCLNAETGKCFPSDDWITCAIGGTRKSVLRARYKLRKYGYLDWRKTGEEAFRLSKPGGLFQRRGLHCERARSDNKQTTDCDSSRL